MNKKVVLPLAYDQTSNRIVALKHTVHIKIIVDRKANYYLVSNNITFHEIINTTKEFDMVSLIIPRH